MPEKYKVNVDTPLSYYFKDYKERYIKGCILFVGKPRFPIHEIKDRQLIKFVDGGRIVKDYKISRDEVKMEIRVFIEPYTLKEIRAVDSLREYKLGEINGEKLKRDKKRKR